MSIREKTLYGNPYNVSDRLAKGSCIMYERRKEDQDLNEENSCVVQSKSSKLALNLNEGLCEASI